MKILHLITSIDNGGAENHLSCLARGQKLKKNDVTIIFLKGNEFWKKLLKKNEIETINLSSFGSGIFGFIKKIFFIKSFIVKNKIDILHTHLPHMELYSWFVLLFFNYNVKYFITKHVDNNFFGGSKFKSKSILADLINYLLVRKSKKIICISNAVKKYYIKNYFKLKKNKLKVIYYGVDKEYINKLKSNKKLKKIPNKDIIFGAVGRLVRQKNFELIIESYKRFTQKTKKTSCLVIAGKGPEEAKLKKFAKKINIDDKIVWMGHVNNIGNIFQKIHVFCMNSRFEGLGLVMLEAMSFFKPIIATIISAIPEVVINMQNGILVNQYDVENYSNAMFKLSYKKFRNKLSRKSKTILHKKFNFDIMINKTHELYLN